ncbi:hypothetical protein L292_2080 [Acinetobacter junii CIP 107470 = MTCC 11364]|uniref:Uncharacterized protein n=1 Tax=Acinetobacter junii CIP 107470 = MTCC 11364 TaxID=1217666 RepID=S7WUH8_ACIJU|nr:hypothetical protein [Acinetobacter junii]ENV52070.1 hypothetical protein F953_00482 [Acinetobacter junii CIP 107470 = MTCC 11364]EPR86846.1 hypothetical protein L292_2080 [Acinetobacter junii CIP 107470 = MTCC 11364]
MDKEDILFLQNRIRLLKLNKAKCYAIKGIHKDINKIIDDAITNYEDLKSSLENEFQFYNNIWYLLSLLGNKIFVERPDDFFNTLRAMEREFAGLTLLKAIEIGWLIKTPLAPVNLRTQIPKDFNNDQK